MYAAVQGWRNGPNVWTPFSRACLARQAREPPLPERLVRLLSVPVLSLYKPLTRCFCRQYWPLALGVPLWRLFVVRSAEVAPGLSSKGPSCCSLVTWHDMQGVQRGGAELWAALICAQLVQPRDYACPLFGLEASP